MLPMQHHIFSPYRVCPLGAHVDHQHGLVTAFAIDKGVDLWFDVREDSKVILDSESFTGHVEFDIATPTLVKQGNWGEIMRGERSSRCRSDSNCPMASPESSKDPCRWAGSVAARPYSLPM